MTGTVYRGKHEIPRAYCSMPAGKFPLFRSTPALIETPNITHQSPRLFDPKPESKGDAMIYKED